MPKPDVSILVPAYYGASYLSDCIESVLAQTHQDWELLILDDCSGDDTFEIAKAYASIDSRLRVERNPRNLGLVGNWNRCIELSQGQWIKFVFQDDLIAPTCLEEMLAASTQDTWLTVCRREFLYERGTSEETRRFYEQHPTPERVFGSGASFIAPEVVCNTAVDLYGVNFFGEPTATLIRRAAFARYGLFNPNLSMICDTEYWIRVSAHHGFTYLPITLANFRVHAGSTSAHHFAHRKYRITLDGVVLMHEYVHNPAFAPVRKAAQQRDPPLDLNALLERRIEDARRTAVDAANSLTTPNRTLLREWEELLVRLPNLGHMAHAKPDPWRRLASLWRRHSK